MTGKSVERIRAMKYKLMNFNISYELKSILEELALRKHVSKTAILNSLIATYGQRELHELRSFSKGSN